MKSFFLTALALLTVTLSSTAQQAATSPSPASTPTLQQAYFAGGCFWCMQYAFDKVKGVKKTVVGYTGGQAPSPSYEEVSSGTTGHAESIEVDYDPSLVTYPQLLDAFWKNIDPTQVNGQFADHGTQYRTAIFYRNDEQKQEAEASRDALAKSGKLGNKPIATQIVPLAKFYPAEDYHQEYYKTNATHFNLYEVGSGRAGYLKRMWGTQFPH